MEVDPSAKNLLKHNLNDLELATINSYLNQLNLEYRQRAELMLMRLDVTVDAFFWSERVQKLKDEVMRIYEDRRKQLKIPAPVTLDDLKQASTGFLIFF